MKVLKFQTVSRSVRITPQVPWPILPHRKVQPHPTDIGAALADGVGAWVRVSCGDTALD